MYNANNLFSSLVQLGQWLLQEAAREETPQALAEARNGWFVQESVAMALEAHGQALREDRLRGWQAQYHWPDQATGAKVGLILAGNLPLVGWHDIMCAILAGHDVHVKLSQDDAVLPKWLLSKWAELEPYVGEAVTFHDGLMKGMDAVVATGGANAGRYFQAYFGHLPHLFRGQRTSVAVLDGEETSEQLEGLGNDVFAHFGMGCRSVTKLWLPEGFDLDRWFAAWVGWGRLAQHSKYANNYDYHKAVWLLNREELIENGFVIVKEEQEALVSPIGTLFIERYKDAHEVAIQLSRRAQELQVVSARPGGEASIALNAHPSLRVVALGDNQFPQLGDHADGVDTMEFLLGLSGAGRNA